MSKMSIFDIVALAKAGFTASDVKDLMSQEAEPEAIQKPEEPEEQPEEAPEKPKPENEAEKSQSAEHDNIEEMRKQIQELQAKLEASQASNNHKDLSGGIPAKSNEDILADAYRNLL